jgi:phosphoinositide-3-kinase regulatory subunit 4
MISITTPLRIDQRDQLADVPNVYTYQVFLETEKAGYIIRQWLAHSLFDRISTRPFLSLIEKKWIAFQILTGLFDARKKKVCLPPSSDFYLMKITY